MKSHKYVIMKRERICGVYANVFVHHVELHDSYVEIEYTNDPSEAMKVYGHEVAINYTMLLSLLINSYRCAFITDKIGRFCRPNAYLIYSQVEDSRLIYRSRERAEAALSYLNLFKPVIYPLYGYLGEYDY